MKVSFTGTRLGMSRLQRQGLHDALEELRSSIVLFAHGCCIGADVEAHAIAREVCGPKLFIAALPSTAKTRAQVPSDCNFVARAKPPLERDKDIVDLGKDLLIAAPLTDQESTRSGTWHTIRYAKKIGVMVLLLSRK